VVFIVGAVAMALQVVLGLLEKGPAQVLPQRMKAAVKPM